MKRREKKGFTLAELLVVVAIIGVLVAVAIPVFNSSLEKAKLAADHATIRDAYAQIQYARLTGQVQVDGEYQKFGNVTKGNTIRYYVTADGGLTTNASKAYKMQAGATMSNVASAACETCKSIIGGDVLHVKDSVLYYYYENVNDATIKQGWTSNAMDILYP